MPARLERQGTRGMTTTTAAFGIYFGTYFYFRAIEQNDPEVDVVQDMKRILVQLGAPEEAKPPPPVKEKSDVKGRKSATPGDDR